MKSALELYKDIQIELDKFGSPSFTLIDFYYFYNKARLEYCNLKYKEFETSQVVTDELEYLIAEPLIKKGTAINFLNEGLLNKYPDITEDLEGSNLGTVINKINAYDMNDNYYHLLSSNVLYKFNDSYKCYPKGAIIEKVCKKLTDDRKGYITDKVFYKPNWERPYYKIEGGNVKLELGILPKWSNVDVFIKIIFLKLPKLIILAGSDLSNPSVNTISEFNAENDNEHIKHCIKLFLENIEQERLRTFIPTNQPN